MFCSACGHEVEESYGFCPNCGKKLASNGNLVDNAINIVIYLMALLHMSQIRLWKS